MVGTTLLGSKLQETTTTTVEKDMSTITTDEKLQNGTTVAGDEAELAKMGYKQELNRDLSLVQVSKDVP